MRFFLHQHVKMPVHNLQVIHNRWSWCFKLLEAGTSLYFNGRDW